MPGAASPRPVNNIPLRPELPVPPLPSLLPKKVPPPRGPGGRFIKKSHQPTGMSGTGGASASGSDFDDLGNPSRPVSPSRTDQRIEARITEHTRALEQRLDARFTEQTNSFNAALDRLTRSMGASNIQAQHASPLPSLTPFTTPAQQLLPPTSTPADQHTNPPVQPPPGLATGVPPSIHTQAYVPQNGYLPPLTSNPAAGASPSIASLFPHVHQDILSSVTRHELRAEDLYKLDFRFREQTLDMPLTVKDGQIRYAGTDIAARYKTPDSLLTPFVNYITILTISSIQSGIGSEVIAALNEYLHQLHRNIADYEWNAVVAYHMQFWSHRCFEMRQGLYSRWALVDHQLHSRFLTNHLKRAHSSGSKSSPSSNGAQSSQVCFKHNKGTCSSPCPHGRRHVCSQCNSNAHTVAACPQKAEKPADKSK